ncbi:MAG: DUF1553 domain-containing protein [Planctomyces sp.]|nr:DUF1553 domain-containing protein [Planctomyces sp.]
MAHPLPLSPLLAMLAFLPSAAAADVDFERDVRPILTQHCAACHGRDEQHSGLRFDRGADALRGGDSGTAIIPGDAAGSPLIERVSADDPDLAMPPKGERLTAEQVATLRSWIDAGADWPNADAGDDPLDWWSLRPLNAPEVPAAPVPPGFEAWARTPIDRFILAQLAAHDLAPSPEADRRTLIRRLSFDLTGLPPTPDDIAAFVSDESPGAYERLVDRLLASEAYGERWARHWLDVVHYGDTHGYDKDQPRPNAWPYRDYVIRSLNADKPYSRFIEEQLAGDVLHPGTRDGVTALGFIAAGPWDLIGHAEVPETKTDGMIARHLDRDDMATNAFGTFLSLTIQCAQCHRHKFDPIEQEDYYRVQAVFAALDRADRPFHSDETDARRYADLLAEKGRVQSQRDKLDREIRDAGGDALAALDERIANAEGGAATPPEHGYHSGIETAQDVAKWVQIDLGARIPLHSIVLWACHDDFNGIGAGFGFPVRFRIELADDPAFESTVTTLIDRTANDVPNPGTAPHTFAARAQAGRYVRITATKLAPRQNDFIFALAEFEAIDAEGRNVAAGAPVQAADSIEAPIRWRTTNLTDGLAPGKAIAVDAAALRAEREALLERVVPDQQRQALAALRNELAQIESGLAEVQPSGTVYAGTIHHGGGSAFRGTGPDGGRPRSIRVLDRGDVKSPGEEVGPGVPALVRELAAEFELPEGHAEGERRAALARWITDPRNPLPWRSIVNRVWQYHFGRGIVATPNDFGRMGQLPSHPELLDWLAADFRDSGQSLKRLHWMIVLSATYRQASTGRADAELVDADNVWLWRMNRRKLEAEAVRDAALAVAGALDPKMYGPAFQDFVVERPEHSPHYQYHLHDPDAPDSHRRSVYRFLVRSKPQPFMTVLDCADPSMQVDRRSETLSPLQALSMFNNGFMLAMSRRMADRVSENQAQPEDRIDLAFRLAIGRSPSPDERAALVEYADQHGLANACRVILNLNEFLFID